MDTGDALGGPGAPDLGLVALGRQPRSRGDAISAAWSFGRRPSRSLRRKPERASLSPAMLLLVSDQDGGSSGGSAATGDRVWRTPLSFNSKSVAWGRRRLYAAAHEASTYTASARALGAGGAPVRRPSQRCR
jgi:hypothetical protein